MSQLRPHLSKHIRLQVYSYLDVDTKFKKIGLLSKLEREELKNSYIAREGHTWSFHLINWRLLDLSLNQQL